MSARGTPSFRTFPREKMAAESWQSRTLCSWRTRPLRAVPFLPKGQLSFGCTALSSRQHNVYSNSTLRSNGSPCRPDDEVTESHGKAKGKNDEQWPAHWSSQQGMWSCIARCCLRQGVMSFCLVVKGFIAQRDTDDSSEACFCGV